MSDFIKLLLLLSASGTLLIFAIMLLKKNVFRKISHMWQYYIWLIVIARLLIPYSPEINLMNQGLQRVENVVSASSDNVDNTFAANQGSQDSTYSNQLINEVPDTDTNADKPSITADINWNRVFLVSSIAIWVAVAGILLVNKIIIYCNFRKYILHNSVAVDDLETLEILGSVLEEMNIKQHVRIYTNNMVSSPLLIGFIKGIIIFPTLDISKEDYRYILIHELTHYKRKDMFYKWLVQITLCLHWFNPFVYWMAKDISHCCELACDEAVVINMSEENRLGYGDMLLNEARPGIDKQNSFAAVSLINNAMFLKERLSSIKNTNKKGKNTRLLKITLTVLLCISAFFLGTFHRASGEVPEEILAAVQNESTTDSQSTNEDNNIEKAELVSYENTAQEAYTQADPLKYQSALPYLSYEVLNSYMEKAYNDGRMEILQFTSSYVSADIVKKYADKAYNDDRIDLFAVVMDSLSESDLDNYYTKAVEDSKIGFTTVLENR